MVMKVTNSTESGNYLYLALVIYYMPFLHANLDLLNHPCSI